YRDGSGRVSSGDESTDNADVRNKEDNLTLVRNTEYEDDGRIPNLVAEGLSKGLDVDINETNRVHTMREENVEKETYDRSNTDRCIS
ncbi:hypothetical protein Dimus_021924, partial [Dionaea muscipula]